MYHDDPALARAIEEALEQAEDEETEDYILEYTRNTPSEQQSVEDFEQYMESYERSR